MSHYKGEKHIVFDKDCTMQYSSQHSFFITTRRGDDNGIEPQQSSGTDHL